MQTATTPSQLKGKSLFFLLLVFIGFSSFGQGHTFSYNGNFEGAYPDANFLTKWVKTRDISVYKRDTLVKLEGKASLQIQSKRAFYGGYPAAMFQDISTLLEKYRHIDSITISVWAKKDTGRTTRKPQLQVYMETGRGKNIDTASSEGSNENRDGWAKLVLRLGINDVVKSASVYLNVPYQGRVWFDKLEIVVNNQLLSDRVPTKSSLPVLQPLLVKNAVPFPLDKPIAPTSALIKSLASKSLIGIGEATHGTKEDYLLRAKLCQYLIEHQNAQHLVIEANASDVFYLNEYLQHGKGNVRELVYNLHGFEMKPYGVEEFLALMQWVRNYNLWAAQKVTVYGADIQLTYKSYQIVQTIANKLTTADQAVVQQYTAPVASFWQQNRFAYPFSDSVINRVNVCKAACTSLKDYFDKNRAAIANRLDAQELTDLLYQANCMYLHFLCGERFAAQRDSIMAANVLWLSKRANGSKVIALAHNFHVSAESNYLNSGIKLMGSYLKDSLQNNYCIIGTCFYKGVYTANVSARVKQFRDEKGYFTSLEMGDASVFEKNVAHQAPENSVEWCMKKAGLDHYMIDASAIRNNKRYAALLKNKLVFRDIGLVAMDCEQFPEASPFDIFDWIFYADETGATKYVRQ